MKKYNIIDNLHQITDIPTSTLNDLIKISNLVISSDIYSTQISNENESCIDIGIGKLYIIVEQGEIKYKFIPSANLESTLVKTIKYNNNYLSQELDKSLVQSIERTYKSLF